ncbi:MAG: hypothetical protein J3K34DRAFT_523121 [Monoraphidium minutum]|nr:MAG: hypothetical protein J3K34DRAFT_523121 [Monoraphidium minutum]
MGSYVAHSNHTDQMSSPAARLGSRRQFYKGGSRRRGVVCEAQAAKGAFWSKRIVQQPLPEAEDALAGSYVGGGGADADGSSSAFAPAPAAAPMTVVLPVDGGHAKRKAGSKADEEVVDYARSSTSRAGRTGWLVAFCAGLLLAALVVERFEGVLEQHVELSFFVPLIMGHGGNTGSQSVTTVIRALALKQVTNRDVARVVLKEAGAGCMMGAVLGLAILAFSGVWSGISTEVGAAVAIALPIVSLWANGLGAFFTLLADRYGFDPAVTSVPLVTTMVDTTGLVVYFYIAMLILGVPPTEV